MKEGSRRTKNRRFIIELKYIAMNIIISLYLEIISKISAFGIRGSLGEKEDFFVSLLWLGG